MTESKDLSQSLQGDIPKPARKVSDALQALDPENIMPPMQREIAGIYVAMGFIDRKARDPQQPGLTQEDIFAVNKAVMNDSLNPHRYGHLRRVPIYVVAATVRGERRVSVIKYPGPDELPGEFDNYTSRLDEMTTGINGDTPIAQVLNVAAFAHDEMVRIHPFRDGNGRTARAVVDFIFKRAGFSYITDWGAKDDEYKDTVDRRFREENPDLTKAFLASKLVKRVGELRQKGLVSLETFNRVKSGAGEYVQGLSLNAA